MTTITIDGLERRGREVIDALAQGAGPVTVTREGAGVAQILPSNRASDEMTEARATSTQAEVDA